MFPHRPHPSNKVSLIAVLFAILLAAAACSGTPDVEAEAASAAADAETTDDEDAADGNDTAEAEDAESVELETDAMGEDVTDADDAPSTTEPAVDDSNSGSTAAALDDAELAAALEAGTSDRFSLPFMYLTVDQDCDGCAPTASLYYVPGPVKASILTLEGVYIDGVLQPDFSAVDPVLQAGDPRRVAEQLSGTDATYGIDPVSGAITSWSLDGNSVTLRCLQVDTRPVDMRTELCENSLIG